VESKRGIITLHSALGFVNLKIADSHNILVKLETPKVSRRLLQLLHCLGFSCIGGAVFLQILVFADIVVQGYFFAVEKNQLILSLEVVLTLFALIYFLYVYQRFMRSLK
jgi:hypothetical protein